MTTYIGNLFIEFIIRPIWAKFQVINCLSQFRLPYHAWQGLNKIYFLTVPEAGNPRSRCGQGWFLLRPLSLACRQLPSPSVLT